MKGYLASAAFAAGLIFAAFPTPSMAQADSSTVTAPPTLAAWSQKVFKDLDRQLRVPVDDRSQVMPNGITAVKFGCSDNGAPSSVELHKSSGDRRLDFATLRAVRKVATLHPLPDRLGHDQTYIVRVLFSNSASDAERQIKKMQEDAARSNAWYNQNSSSTAAIELVPVG